MIPVSRPHSGLKTWFCKIGEAEPDDVPQGGDFPMRRFVEDAYRRVTGKAPEFIFSGWNAELTESERAVVENRVPESTLKPHSELFARVRSALGASGQQEARGLAALEGIEEQFEVATRKQDEYRINTTTGGQAVTVTTEDRFFRALVQIRNVLGPDSFGCSEPICEGCQAEGAEALRIANEALGFASGQSTDTKSDAST